MFGWIKDFIPFTNRVRKTDSVANFITSIVRELSSIITSFENKKDFKTEILPLIVKFLNKYKHRDKKSIADLGSFEKQRLLVEVFVQLDIIKQNHINFNILNWEDSNGAFLKTLRQSLIKIQIIRQKISNLEN